MEAVPHMRKLVLAGGIAVVASLGATTPAYGGGCSPSSNNPPSSVSQYVEQQPTACGNQATGQGGNSTRKVPKQIQSRIQQLGGNDATALTNIVSQQKYGAPTTKIKVHKVKGKSAKNGKGSGQSKILSDSETRAASASHESPLAASVGVITDGSDGRLIALVVLMLAVAAVVVFSALRRRRDTR